MKKLFLVANWKSHKTINEAHSFMIAFLNSSFSQWLHTNEENAKKIIICPPSLLLPELAKMLAQASSKIPIELGAQDVSPFKEGAYTGEIAADELTALAKYVIIGHSESRREFNESDEIVLQKAERAREVGLEPIFCVQDKMTPVPDNSKFIAYEPLDAIGSSHPDDPAHAEEVALFYKEERGVSYVLYGGSVTPENVYSYTSQEHIDGVLVGGASLDPTSFANIIQRA